VEIVKKVKSLLKRLLILLTVGCVAYLLFASGTIYVKSTNKSVTIGVNLGSTTIKEPYLPTDLDAQLKENREVITDTEEMLKKAKEMGIIFD